MALHPSVKHNHRKKIVKFKINFSWKNFFLYGFLGLFILFIIVGASTPLEPHEKIPLSQLITEVKKGNVKQITVQEDKLVVETKKATVVVIKEPGSNVYELFKNAGVSLEQTKVAIKDNSGIERWGGLLINVLPIVLMIAFFYFLFRQARGAQESIFSFGQSKAKLFNKDLPKTTFADVAGVDEAKQELTEIVDFLKNPGKYKAMGARTPKG
ncbi:MAG: ATP-dependent metallopeptidase FtsH/Yme1/Tma family protein, partial [Patescibacteria group bacterium]